MCDIYDEFVNENTIVNIPENVDSAYKKCSNKVKNLFDKLSGFDESLKEEDWDFVIRSAANTNFTSIKEPLFFYRSHESNIMKKRGRKEIFKQKILLLTKNFNLVSPFRWYFSISLHFFYDIIYKGGK